MTTFKLKIIALVTMLIDHMGAVIPEFFGFEPQGLNYFRVIGRLAFPIFVYLIAEGFRYTKNRAKYLARLFAFAIISQIPFALAFNSQISFFADTNIFYTLFLGGAAIVVYEMFREKNIWTLVAVLPAIGFALLAEFLTADYGAYGVVFIFLMYVIKNFRPRLAAMAVLCLWQHEYTLELLINGYDVSTVRLLMIPATLVPVLLIFFYNGKPGMKMKWLFYIAYPAHLLILSLL
jgi:hypothetical protein